MLESGASKPPGGGESAPPATKYTSQPIQHVPIKIAEREQPQAGQPNHAPATPNPVGRKPVGVAQRKTGRRVLSAAAILLILAIIAGIAVAIVLARNENESDSVASPGDNNTTSPTNSPSTVPPSFSTNATLSPTAVTFSPTQPSRPPVPPPDPVLADCTIMFGDMRVASSPFSYITQTQASSGLLVTGVFDSGKIVSASSPTSTLLLDFKASNGSNLNNIGSVSGSVFTAEDLSISISAAVNNPNFYIRKVGGTNVASPLLADFFDPNDVEHQLLAFEARVGTTPRTVTAMSPAPTIAIVNDEGLFCFDRFTPSPACAGPWYSYTYVEVCPTNRFATKAPTHITAPTPFTTAAPSINSPLIELVFTNPFTPTEIRRAFENARDFWNNKITNTHEPINIQPGVFDAGELGCNATESVFPIGTTQITGLTIFAAIGPIDGVDNILGQAGPCAFSYYGFTSEAFGNVLPRIGLMSFDVADLQAMLENGSLERVVMHEMAHVLGIGTNLWERFRWGKSFVGGEIIPGSDPRYLGLRGIEGYKKIGGLRDDIPVANTGSSGTADSHWREQTFQDELMTGFATGDMPASLMTLKALQDLGYVIDENKAESYTVPSIQANDLKAETSPILINDVLEFHKPRKIFPKI